MEECVVSVDFRFIGDVNIKLILAAAIISAMTKNWKHACYCVALFSFYSFAYQFHCNFKEIDPERVLRYLIWTGIDVVFLSSLYVLVKANLIRAKMLYVCLTLEFAAILAHFTRMIEIQINGGIFTDSFYSEIIMITNVGFVISAIAPSLLGIFIKRSN